MSFNQTPLVTYTKVVSTTSTVDGNSADSTPNKRLSAKSTPTKEKRMQIRYLKEAGVLLVFPHSEMKVALSILKALYKMSPEHFIGQAISDIEADLQPKQLPIVNHQHICEHCFMMLDDRDSNSFNMTTRAIDGKETSKWVHYKCPELKSKRPV